MKKIICLILALILCIGILAGCGEKQEEVVPAAEEENNKMDAFEQKNEEKKEEAKAEEAKPAPDEQKEVKYQDTIVRLMMDKVNKVSTIDIGGRCMLMGEVWNMCYDTLINLSSDFKEYTPCLATEWDTEDYQHFHFKLREGVKFHNGEPFTADDVLFTYEIGCTSESAGTSLATRCAQIESIEVLNDYEINMTLKQANFDWLYEMATILGFPIVNREAIEADRDAGAMVGTGPWKITEFVSGDYIVYERNDDYFDELPPTKKVIFRYISEVTARNIMVENGEADSSVLNEADIAKYDNNPNFVIDYKFNSSCGYLSFNTQRPNTSDYNFRMAVAYAVNVQEMIDIALNGYGKAQPNSTLWGMGTAYYNEDIPLIEQDLEKAKEYLAKSSYDGGKVEIVATLGYTQSVAQVVMAQLQAIGIDAYVTSVDNATLSQRGRWDNNDIDILVLQQMMGPLGKDINNCLTPNSDYNKAKWINEEAAALAEKALYEPDGEERQADYYRIQELMFEEMPYFPTYHVGIWALERAGVGGVNLFPNANNDFSMIYRIIPD